MRFVTRGELFARRAVKLYTALLAAGETEISRHLLESTMAAAAAVARLEGGAGHRSASKAHGEPKGREGESRTEALLGRSLFWICQVPDGIAAEHGGPLFREGLRLLLEAREARAAAASGEPGDWAGARRGAPRGAAGGPAPQPGTREKRAGRTL